MTILEKFGKRLKKQRESSKMTQEDLAYKAELTVYYISRIERGKSNPSLEVLSKVAKALKIDLGDLVEGL